MFAGKILAGGLLLVFGRKLFWFYIALLGFAAGLNVSTQLFHVQEEWLRLLIGIAFGVIGAVLAYFFQKIAIGVAGFLGGAYVATSLLAALVPESGRVGNGLEWILFFVGGILGVIVATTLFDWALMI